MDQIQYVQDSQGRKTAVLIPIELWDQWRGDEGQALHKDSFSIKKYRGILKGAEIRGREEETRMRDEWD